jgi:two-component system, OmpR family, catabolic regulation response regulator CreB
MANDVRPGILIVEDEPAIADTLVYALKTEGFAPEWCTTGRAALAALAAQPFALVVLDVGLPDGSGFEVCKQIRARSAVPVIFLTARNTELDRVLGLELGGDDYLAKPFSPRELTARVKAILRRAGGAREPGPSGGAVAPTGPELPTAKYHAAPAGAESRARPDFVVDDERCAISFRGVPLELTRYEFRLLKTFGAKPGRVFSRDQLMAAAWEDPGASLDRTVDAHIKTLRAKLRAVAPDADPIQTHRGLGYSLRAARP